jgi:hypothetical protein
MHVQIILPCRALMDPQRPVFPIPPLPRLQNERLVVCQRKLTRVFKLQTCKNPRNETSCLSLLNVALLKDFHVRVVSMLRHCPNSLNPVFAVGSSRAFSLGCRRQVPAGLSAGQVRSAWITALEVHTYTHTYIHTYIHTRIHTHIHAHIHPKKKLSILARNCGTDLLAGLPGLPAGLTCRPAGYGGNPAFSGPKILVLGG